MLKRRLVKPIFYMLGEMSEQQVKSNHEYVRMISEGKTCIFYRLVYL